jgi:2-polyprenyl-3-methyl-5-hydroxy-6-metoxy-1,4-benzoquinol methylase
MQVQFMKTLVVIASYGTGNDEYLHKVVRSYRAMPFAIDIVIVSNVTKSVPSGVELVTGQPTRNPHSLPFAHRKVMADRVADYDLFIYSEDDILITEDNIRSFLRVSDLLPDHLLAGLMRYEVGARGDRYFPEVHNRFHWDPCSVISVHGHTFAYFNNEHAGCYIVTRDQLERAIATGNFLVSPHEGKYGMLETASTDIYTQCGFRKVLCISHLQDFLVHHLPNKYLDTLGTKAVEVERQLLALLSTSENPNSMPFLVDTRAEHKSWPFAANYYEPARSDFITHVPPHARTILSIGCGWGATEEALIRSGIRVYAVPLDPIISACAEARGVEVLNGRLDAVLDQVNSIRFDCVLLSNVLHLVPDPQFLLASVAKVLNEGAVVIAAVPNLRNARVLWRSLRRDPYYVALGSFQESGVHLTTKRVLQNWLGHAGLQVQQVMPVFLNGPHLRKLHRSPLGVFNSLFTSEFVMVAQKA